MQQQLILNESEHLCNAARTVKNFWEVICILISCPDGARYSSNKCVHLDKEKQLADIVHLIGFYPNFIHNTCYKALINQDPLGISKVFAAWYKVQQVYLELLPRLEVMLLRIRSTATREFLAEFAGTFILMVSLKIWLGWEFIHFFFI